MGLEREEIGYTPRDPNTIDLKNSGPIWFPEHTFPGHIPKDLLRSCRNRPWNAGCREPTILVLGLGYG